MVCKIKEIINWLLGIKKHSQEKCFACCNTGLTNLNDYDGIVEIQEWCDYCDSEAVEYTIGKDGNYLIK